MTDDDSHIPEIDRLLQLMTDEEARLEPAATSAERSEAAALREVADWLDLADADELAPADPPHDLLR